MYAICVKFNRLINIRFRKSWETLQRFPFNYTCVLYMFGHVLNIIYYERNIRYLQYIYVCLNLH